MKKIKIRYVAKFVRGVSYKKDVSSKIQQDNYVVVLRANNIENGNFLFDDVIYVPSRIIKDEQYVNQGDIVITMSSGSKTHVGKVALARKNTNCSFGAFCGKLVPEGISAEYLFYSLRNIDFRKHIEHLCKGTNINNIKQEYILDYELNLPTFDEQKRIVDKIEELFSKLDKGVEELNKIKEQLKIYRQAVLKETLESNKPNHRIEDVVISFQNGIAKRSGKDGKEILVLRLADVSNDSVIVSNDMRRILLSEEEQKTYVLDKDDAIIIRVNGSPDRVGRMILVDQGNTYAFCDHLIRCKFNEKIVLPKYIKYCMDASACRKYIEENMVSTAGQNTISQSTIKNCPIFVPDIKEQETLVKQIESRLSVCDKIEQTVNESLQKAESLRQSILRQAFEGKLLY